MPGCPVLLADAEVGKQVLEPVAPAGEARRVHRSVVGERGRRPAVLVARRSERRHHVVATDSGAGSQAQQVPGVVVQPVDDLDLSAVRETPMGEVGLPHLVGRRGLEPDPGTARALAWLSDDEAGRVEDAPDGRGRRDRAPLTAEVPGDRDRTAIEPVGGELRPQLDDPGAHGIGRPARVGARSARARLEGIEPALPVPAQKPVQVPAAHPALGRGGGDGQLLCDDLKDGHPMLRHWAGRSICSSRRRPPRAPRPRPSSGTG